MRRECLWFGKGIGRQWALVVWGGSSQEDNVDAVVCFGLNLEWMIATCTYSV